MPTTQHPTKHKEIFHVIHNEKVVGKSILCWFDDISVQANSGKYQLLLSGNDSCNITIANKTLSSSKCEKL